MLDAPLRKLTDPLFARTADALAWRNIRPSRLVVLGFVLSLLAFPAIVLGHYIAGLVMIALGRSVDGLGAAVKRQNRASDLGDFLDVSLEYIYCAAIPFAFALADPTRRRLLDLLYERNGQTLGELCEHLDMARQSATQHLGLLEAANLVSTVWRGREKLHFINPVPLHEVYERWVRKFERQRLSLLHDLKKELEGK